VIRDKIMPVRGMTISSVSTQNEGSDYKYCKIGPTQTDHGGRLD
jgi:hypothetical protein